MAVGWQPEADVLNARFTVDGSGVSQKDRQCCSVAIDALKREMPAFAPVVWHCTPYN